MGEGAVEGEVPVGLREGDAVGQQGAWRKGESKGRSGLSMHMAVQHSVERSMPIFNTFFPRYRGALWWVLIQAIGLSDDLPMADSSPAKKEGRDRLWFMVSNRFVPSGFADRICKGWDPGLWLDKK